MAPHVLNLPKVAFQTGLLGNPTISVVKIAYTLRDLYPVAITEEARAKNVLQETGKLGATDTVNG